MGSAWWRVLTVVAALSAGVAGCDSDGDGGAIVCTEDVIGMVVRVVDVDGVGVSGATVTAVNDAKGRTAEQTTASDGTSNFRESIGGGTVEMTATLGARSATGDVVWKCGQCHCHPTPASLTLVLPD